MHSILETCDGEFVGRSQRRQRRQERPGANAGVFGAEIRDSKLKSGSQCEQCEFKNGSTSSDGTNLADSDSRAGEHCERVSVTTRRSAILPTGSPPGLFWP